MRKKICSSAGCNNLIDYSEKYCEKHKTEKQKTERVPFQNAKRNNTNLYNTTLWRKLRNEILKQQPYCFKCGISVKESPLEIHHVIAPLGNEDLFYDENNLLPVCQQCHRKITAGEIRNRNIK